jgi:hypothetical protein
MGRITPSHVAGLDLLDKLFFNQILVSCFFTEELVWLRDLDDDLEAELTVRGVEDAKRQLIKHGVLCLMEADLSDSMLLLKESFPDKVPALPPEITADHYKAVEEYEKSIFKASVLAMLAKVHNGESCASIEIAGKLVGKYLKAPATFRYRLTERMFAWNFIAAPLDCFTWLCKMDVLKSAKHPGKVLVARYSQDYLHRLALLCELDGVRSFLRRSSRKGGANETPSLEQISKVRELSPEAISSLINKTTRELQAKSLPHLKNSFPFIDLGDLEKPALVHRFFENLNSYSLRQRAFQGSLASWTGMVCAGLVELFIFLDDKKTAIYTGEINDGTLTERVCKAMSARGFEITPRVVYKRYRDFKETIFRAVDVYYRMKLVENVAYSPLLHDITYETISWHFEVLKPSPGAAAVGFVEQIERRPS